MKMNRILCVVGLMVVLSGCQGVFVGDSIFNSMRSHLDNRTDNTMTDAADGRGPYTAGINGDPGTGLQAILGRVNNVDVGGWMVVELGSNAFHWNAAQRTQFITEVLGAVPNDRCLAWVTPYNVFDPVGTQNWASSIVALITPANQPCSAVVRWDQLAAGQPWFTDGVHLNAVGKEYMACYVAEVIGQPC